MSNLSNLNLNSLLSSLQYSQLGSTGLGSTTGSTDASQFSNLLSSGNLYNTQSINQMNYGGSSSPQLTSMLSEGSNMLSQKLFNKLDPLQGLNSQDDYFTSSTFGNAFLGRGVSTMDMLGTIAANTLPFIKTNNKFGAWIQSIPQLFQMTTGLLGISQALQDYKTEHAPNTISPKMKAELIDDMNNQSFG